jgi:hypothetical protein
MGYRLFWRELLLFSSDLRLNPHRKRKQGVEKLCCKSHQEETREHLLLSAGLHLSLAWAVATQRILWDDGLACRPLPRCVAQTSFLLAFTHAQQALDVSPGQVPQPHQAHEPGCSHARPAA